MTSPSLRKFRPRPVGGWGWGYGLPISLPGHRSAGPSSHPFHSAPAVSEFFNASCVPVNNPKNYPSSLCALCVGDEKGRNKCVGSSQERYYGYSGAFRYSRQLRLRGGLLAWPCSRTVFLTASPPSCVTGALWRMQGMWPSSSTRLSLRTQMVCEGAQAGTENKRGGRGCVRSLELSRHGVLLGLETEQQLEETESGTL